MKIYAEYGKTEIVNIVYKRLSVHMDNCLLHRRRGGNGEKIT